MNVQQKNNSKGFTIIEVVLVLAIAGLIFLMVFIALPALQRNQRDTQRKDDLGRVATALNGYSSSSRGAVPKDATTLGNFVTQFLGGTSTTKAGEEYADPQAGEYTVTFKSGAVATKPPSGTIWYVWKAKCGDGGVTTAVTNARQYAILMTLESQTVPYCLGS